MAATRSPVTTDGSEKERIKYGTASWVYGEELGQTQRHVVVARQHASSPTTASTRSRSPTTTCSSIRPSSRARTTSRPIRRPARRTRSSICSSTTSPSKKTTKIDVRDGKPFDNTVVGHYVYRVSWSPDGTRAALQSHQSPAEHPRVRRRQSRHRRDSRHHPRGMADRVDPEQPVDHFLKDGQTLHLGVGAQRLEQPLSLRSDWQADRAADGAHDVRGRIVAEGGRGGRRVVLHRTRRRQLHEGAVAPSRSRRQAATCG